MATVDPYRTPRQLGSFGYQPVVGLAEHQAEPIVRNESVMGLPAVGQYLYGAFVTDDGYRAGPQRHIRDEVAVSLFYYEITERGGDFTYRRESNRAHRGICEVGQDDRGRWGWWHPEPDPRFVFVFDERAGFWKERGFFEAEGTTVGSVMQWAIPDAEEPFVYVSRYFHCHRIEIEGHGPARGGFFLDTVYLRQGSAWSTSKYLHGIEGAWTSFVTEYEDGAFHFGHLVWSNGNYKLAVINRTDDQPVIRTRIPGEVELDDAGYYERARHDLDDDGVWIWQPLPEGGGRMPPSPLETGPCWRDGQVTREGESRPIAYAAAWSEVYPAHLDAF